MYVNYVGFKIVVDYGRKRLTYLHRLLKGSVVGLFARWVFSHQKVQSVHKRIM